MAVKVFCDTYVVHVACFSEALISKEKDNEQNNTEDAQFVNTMRLLQ